MKNFLYQAEQQFERLAGAGYTLVINLAMLDSDNALENQNLILAKLNIEYHHIPVTWDAPKNTDILKFFSVMKNNKNKKILLHCAYNYRASAFLYLYKKHVLHLGDLEARQIMDSIWQPNKTWQQLINSFSY